MKRILLAIMLFIGLNSFGQNLNTDDVFITMSMEPIIECLNTPDYIQVVNTTPATISFCDRLVYVGPGVHRISKKVMDTDCNIYVFEGYSNGEVLVGSIRIVEGGIQEFSWTMDGIIFIGNSDYKEIILKDMYLFSY